jgi:hypothetical protein
MAHFGSFVASMSLHVSEFTGNLDLWLPADGDCAKSAKTPRRQERQEKMEGV